MKMSWLSLSAALLALAGCTPDQTLESVIPQNALAVVLIEQPGLTSALLGPGNQSLPWTSLDGSRPWAAAVVPANPPGLLVALALDDRPQAWVDAQAWARERGGLTAKKIGRYAVLTSPELPPVEGLDPARRFDLSRVRKGGDWVALYIDVANVLQHRDLLGPLGLPLVPPGLSENLAGLRLGLSGRSGGAEVRLTTDWRSGAPWARELRPTVAAAPLGPWTGLLPKGEGLGVVASLAPENLKAAGLSLPDQGLRDRWAALVPLLGPRVAVSAAPRADGTWSWAAAVETPDPQGVRQALRTLVASGDVQRQFPQWALDPDTPLLYQDRPDGFGGLLGSLALGETTVQIGYGNDRVALASGAGAEEVVRAWRKVPGSMASWAGEIPAGASAAGAGSLDGLGARTALSLRDDGNWEWRLWVDAASLKAWEERLPQAAVGWLSGEGGWTRWEP